MIFVYTFCGNVIVFFCFFFEDRIEFFLLRKDRIAKQEDLK